jgi:RimJ/RimL family protein N-acetyltransferase
MNYWEGEKIRLRSLEPEDAEFFYNWNLDTNTQRNLAWIWFPTSMVNIKDWIKREGEKSPDNEEHFFVIETFEGAVVGSISANMLNKMDGTFRYGLGIIEEQRKKGYASEAIRIFLNYYFNELRYNKVNAAVYAFNESSITLHERLGFKLEGRLREAKFTDGKYWDCLIFGMTKKEFKAF